MTVGEVRTEPEIVDVLLELVDRLDRIVAMFEEFTPAIRAYFDPNQGGARGFAIRRAMGKGARDG